MTARLLKFELKDRDDFKAQAVGNKRVLLKTGNFFGLI